MDLPNVGSEQAVSRCPKTQALIFTKPSHVKAREAQMESIQQENAALKALMAQLVEALPKSTRGKLDEGFLAELNPPKN